MNFWDLSDILRDKLLSYGLKDQVYAYTYLLLGLIGLSAICFLLWSLSRFIIIRVVRKLVTHTKTTWDDQFFHYKVFRSLALILIAIIIAKATPALFRDFPFWTDIAHGAARIYIVLSVMFAINAILNSIVGIMESLESQRDKPIRSYKQVAKIVFYLIGFVLILAIIVGQSPLYILGGFGAVTAIVLLIFRDPILGFVASIQMSAMDLVRIGDWITVDKFGADGSVIEINLTTIKVRNWDMTITIVPSYALVSESFRNWRGMQESEGRLIKRHLNIKISSIRFCDEEMFAQLLKVELIREYLLQRQAEISEFNKANQIDKSSLLNGRQLTNIGVFREYAQRYISRNKNINTEMIFFVRQLQSTENGLPLEVYAFSKEKELELFEAIVSDIFDHLLAAVPYFGLEIFQSPAGSDLQQLTQREEEKK